MADVKLAWTSHALAHQLDVDDDEVARRKEFLEFQDGDVEVLKGLREVARKWADPVIEEFYKHVLSFEETRSFFLEAHTLEHVKKLQREYFLRLTEGEYGSEYVTNRLRIGAAHERVNLAPKWYLGMYSFYLRAVARRLVIVHQGEPERAFNAFLSLLKLVFLDIGLAVDTYVHAREMTMRKQQEAIRELSTPVLQIRDRLLLLPIIGVIDTHRARLITESLLRSIRDTRAKVIVMDVTGVATIDSKVANHLIQTVTAAGLMGASVIVTGLSSDVAQALVGLGLDLAKLNTAGDLQGGIEEAERLLGYRVVRHETGGARAD
ncbi:MAG: protoglobin domain-containing protein [Anaeromyxobacteraceae bacterium]